MIPEELAISYEIKFKKVNDLSKADLKIYNAKDEDSVKTVKVVKTVDSNQSHPLTTSDVVERINKEIETRGLSFVPYTLSQNKNFTKDTLGLFIKKYGIKENKEYCYFFAAGHRYTYSYKLIEYIIQCIIDDPEVFVKIKNENKKS